MDLGQQNVGLGLHLRGIGQYQDRNAERQQVVR
jgi:hypothetical protein